MTNVMYIKSLSKTNHYIANKDFMNIISISQNSLYVMAEDEGMGAEGAYKIIKINKRTFEKMRGLVINNKRKELTSILKDIHNKNKEVLKNSSLQLRMVESRYNTNSKWLEQTKQVFINYFNNNKPILD